MLLSTAIAILAMAGFAQPSHPADVSHALTRTAYENGSCATPFNALEAAASDTYYEYRARPKGVPAPPEWEYHATDGSRVIYKRYYDAVHPVKLAVGYIRCAAAS